MFEKKSALPDWINWIAQDANGKWWGYSAEPHRHDQGWYENEVGRCQLLRQDPPNPGWPQTLRRINSTQQEP